MNHRKTYDQILAENCVKDIMNFIFGSKWEDDPSLAGTPERYVRFLMEFMQKPDYEDIFRSTFAHEDETGSLVMQTPIPFRMICEHHLLPATGIATLGYIADKQVIGLSKLTRLVQAVGVERPSLQEVIAKRIVDLMEEHLKPLGTMLVVQAEHGCMACRGVNRPGIDTITSTARGAFLTNAAARQEFLMLMQARRK